VNAWAKAHPDIVAQFVKDNPGTPHPQASDLAVVFFEHFSKDHPGTFPCSVTQTSAGGKPVAAIAPTVDCTDIRSDFFDMWRQDHPDAPLADVPGDYVTASASGLDPDITLDNAEFQLGRVADKWAQDLRRNPERVREEIQAMLQTRAFSPGGGLFGGPIVNVLQMNLALRSRYGAPP
jgi:potassium-transporting ATPase KdpC subunit